MILQGLTSRSSMKLMTLTWLNLETLGVVSMKSTLSCTSQWKTLMKVRMVNIATKPTLNSSLKMVMARQVSITAWLILSLIRSTSESLSCPRKIWRHGQQSGDASVANMDHAGAAVCVLINDLAASELANRLHMAYLGNQAVQA